MTETVSITLPGFAPDTPTQRTAVAAYTRAAKLLAEGLLRWAVAEAALLRFESPAARLAFLKAHVNRNLPAELKGATQLRALERQLLAAFNPAPATTHARTPDGKPFIVHVAPPHVTVENRVAPTPVSVTAVMPPASEAPRRKRTVRLSTPRGPVSGEIDE